MQAQLPTLLSKAVALFRVPVVPKVLPAIDGEGVGLPQVAEHLVAAATPPLLRGST